VDGVGREIKRLRDAKDWTGAQLAVYAGMSPSAVSQIETGRRSANTASLTKLADALGVGVADLFPKDQASLSFESEQRRQATLENIVALIDSMDDEQLVRFREFLKEERIALGLAHHDNPDSRTIEVQYARAVERLMQATFELIERGYGREETMHSEERSASAS